MVRAKFQVTEVTQYGNQYGHGKRIKLTPVYDDTIPENKRFAQATPSGSLEMHVNNPSAEQEMQVDRTFYVDFTPVE